MRCVRSRSPIRPQGLGPFPKMAYHGATTTKPTTNSADIRKAHGNRIRTHITDAAVTIRPEYTTDQRMTSSRTDGVIRPTDRRPVDSCRLCSSGS